MYTRIVLASIGMLGLGLTLLQTHSPAYYLDRLYTLTGLQTQAEELSLEKVSGAMITDAALEKVVIYRTKQYATIQEKAAKEIRVWATAYTSRPQETDSTPFVTASGTRVRDGVVASNFLPMGSKFKIPSLYGDKVFIVEDRMNSRYDDVKIIDIWFVSHGDAIQFGKRSIVLQLL